MNTLLIVDDEKNIRNGLVTALTTEGYLVHSAANGVEALNIINHNAKEETSEIDIVVTDLRMPEMGGEELFEKIHTQWPHLPVIILTGHGTVETAVQMMKKGAYDFLAKPVNLNHLSAVIGRATKNLAVLLYNRSLTQQVQKLRGLGGALITSASAHKILEMVKQVAHTTASVLITGESGVGKEVVADSIHQYSNRRDYPMIKVHCAALSEALLESELFGHEKGSFTGAIASRKGRFELAHKGTIFLDEIGEINQNIQVKILRVLQEKSFERVGGEKTINVDVRIIAATNKNLAEAIQHNTFREDLYYRLNVVNIHVPPLRERAEDIINLASYFLTEIAHTTKPHIKSISKEAQQTIQNYSWPGNIRELRNCIESAVVMCKGSQVDVADLPHRIQEKQPNKHTPQTSIPIGTNLESAEKQIIQNTLSYLKGNKTKTAEMLGIQRVTLYEKIKKYGIL